MSVVRCGHVKLRTNKSSLGSKPQYCWQLTRVADFEKFQRWMLPWMGKRRAKQFQKAWDAYKANPPKTRE